jgi:hypothetical protein
MIKEDKNLIYGFDAKGFRNALQLVLKDIGKSDVYDLRNERILDLLFHAVFEIFSAIVKEEELHEIFSIYEYNSLIKGVKETDIRTVNQITKYILNKTVEKLQTGTKD